MNMIDVNYVCVLHCVCVYLCLCFYLYIIYSINNRHPLIDTIGSYIPSAVLVTASFTLSLAAPPGL